MAIMSCPTTGEACAHVAFTEEGRAKQANVFEKCVSDGELRKCGHYVMLAESIKAAAEEEGEN